MTGGTNWDCGEGPVGLSQTESDRSDKVGQVGQVGHTSVRLKI